jgi:hypothetical protein
MGTEEPGKKYLEDQDTPGIIVLKGRFLFPGKEFPDTKAELEQQIQGKPRKECQAQQFGAGAGQHYSSSDLV